MGGSERLVGSAGKMMAYLELCQPALPLGNQGVSPQVGGWDIVTRKVGRIGDSVGRGH